MITSYDETRDAGITHATGFRAAGVRCGLKTAGDDLTLIVSDAPATAAGVFTTNRVQASCVTWSRDVTRSGAARAILCNAGNANCCNGPQGEHDTARSAELAASALGISPAEVAIASTGIIGHPLPMEKMAAGIPLAVQALARGPETDLQVARAMMTTDTYPKLAAATVRSDAWSGEVRLGGSCKGSGMIAPNMATMLAFVTTDAKISSERAQQALAAAVERTFNRVTVDGDTSTNDMVLLLANGAGGAVIEGNAALADFTEALQRVCTALAKEIARDGEGATKLVEVAVRGAGSEADAARIARTIAESPLVKTALYGCDPNWGRILMAAGRAGVEFDPARVDVRLGDTIVFQQGTGAPFDAKAASAYLARKEITITVDLHAGGAAATFWTCDYSYDYIRINAEYHT